MALTNNLGISTRAKDYTGQRFGHLTVLGFSGELTNQGNYIWRCLCDCGKYAQISGGNLPHTISCGCTRSTIIDKKREQRVCSKCKTLKPISDFGNNKSRKDGHSQFCKLCVSELGKLYRGSQREWRREYTKSKRHTDLNFKIADNMRRRMNYAVSNKSESSASLLGCTIPFLLGYLQSKFTGDMTLENYGSVWEIDHIIPCSSFDLSVEDERHRCFGYKNLQPLTIAENRSKGAKYG